MEEITCNQMRSSKSDLERDIVRSSCVSHNTGSAIGLNRVQPFNDCDKKCENYRPGCWVDTSPHNPMWTYHVQPGTSIRLRTPSDYWCRIFTRLRHVSWIKWHVDGRLHARYWSDEIMSREWRLTNLAQFHGCYLFLRFVWHKCLLLCQIRPRITNSQLVELARLLNFTNFKWQYLGMENLQSKKDLEKCCFYDNSYVNETVWLRRNPIVNFSAIVISGKRFSAIALFTDWNS